MYDKADLVPGSHFWMLATGAHGIGHKGSNLECHWGATGMLLGCYWDARRPMSKSNKKEHAGVDTPGMQVVAALRYSCNTKGHMPYNG
jgi:hypothetical protein